LARGAVTQLTQIAHALVGDEGEPVDVAGRDRERTEDEVCAGVTAGARLDDAADVDAGGGADHEVVEAVAVDVADVSDAEPGSPGRLRPSEGDAEGCGGDVRQARRKHAAQVDGQQVPLFQSLEPGRELRAPPAGRRTWSAIAKQH